MPTPPAPPPPGIDIQTAIPWIIAIGGNLISLIWNFVNYRKTTGLQKNIRRETVRLEEFRRVRGPIDLAITELANERANLASMAQSAKPIEEWREQVATSSEKIVVIFLKLQDALNVANSSQYAEGSDWIEGIDATWDQFGNSIDRAQNRNRPENESRLAAGTAAAKIGEIISLVNGKIDREVRRYVSPTEELTT